MIAQSSAKPHMLVMAHFPDVRDALGTLCSEAGYQTSLISGAEEGWQIFRTKHAELLVLFATATHILLISPMPGRPACPGCVVRSRLNMKPIWEVQAFDKGHAVDICASRMLTPFTLAALRPVLAWTTGPEADPGVSLALDLKTLQVSRFSVARHHECRYCSPAPEPAEPFALMSRPRCAPGSSRGKSLGQIDVPVEHLVNPICGLLGARADSIRESPFAILVSGVFQEPAILRRFIISWVGMSSTVRNSLKSGVLEGLERHAGLMPRNKPITRGSYRALEAVAVHPHALGVYSESAYLAEPWLRHFDETEPYDWVEGWDVVAGRMRLLPLDCVYYGLPDILHSNSNGCATGSSREEALLFALFELLERDSFVFHWVSGGSPPRLDVDTTGDPECHALIARIRLTGAEVYLLDGRMDIDLPIVFAVVIAEGSQYGQFLVASGASLDPLEAVRKALYEVAVMLDGFEERARAADTGRLKGAREDYNKIRTIDDHTLLYGLPDTLSLARFLVENSKVLPLGVAFANRLGAPSTSNSLTDDLHEIIGMITAAGYKEVIAFDQTSAEQRDIGVCTVRGVVPGLLPLDFGHGMVRAVNMQRLRDLRRSLNIPFNLPPGTWNHTPHPYP